MARRTNEEVKAEKKAALLAKIKNCEDKIAEYKLKIEALDKPSAKVGRKSIKTLEADIRNIKGEDAYINALIATKDMSEEDKKAYLINLLSE